MPNFTINEDAPILVEFAVKPGALEVAAAEDPLEKSAKALDRAMDTVHHMARRVVDTVEALSKQPSQVEVAFGVKFDAEAGAIITKAGVEASINIKLIWTK